MHEDRPFDYELDYVEPQTADEAIQRYPIDTGRLLGWFTGSTIGLAIGEELTQRGRSPLEIVVTAAFVAGFVETVQIMLDSTENNPVAKEDA